MVNKKLLFEIGVEDLPSKNLHIFSEKIKKSIEENFKKNSISFSSINNFYTNIRLVFIVLITLVMFNYPAFLFVLFPSFYRLITMPQNRKHENLR